MIDSSTDGDVFETVNEKVLEEYSETSDHDWRSYELRHESLELALKIGLHNPNPSAEFLVGEAKRIEQYLRNGE